MRMLTYKTFMRHAEKVTKEAPETRPILKGVLHQEDGSCIVTDSFRLYFVKNIHDHSEKAVITPKGRKLNGEYPDLSWVIQNSNYAEAEQEIQVNVGDLLKAIDLIYSVAKNENETVPVKFRDNVVSYTGMQLQAKCELPFKFNEPVALNAKHMLEALRFFKAAKCKEVKTHFHGRMRPISLKNENITVLIMPIRRV